MHDKEEAITNLTVKSNELAAQGAGGLAGIVMCIQQANTIRSTKVAPDQVAEPDCVTIDVDIFYDADAVLIICAPTGIFYTAQAGGMSCTHPIAQGFAFPIFNPVQKVIDDCEYGCSDIHGDRDRQKKLADDLDVALRRETEQYGFSLRFDYERIDELMEGWWPVVVSGNVAHVGISAKQSIHATLPEHSKPLNHKAYLATGNCD